MRAPASAPRPEMEATRSPRRDRRSSFFYWTIALGAWAFVNALAALGLLIGLFILMANASFEGFFREGLNLSQHYLSAPRAARAEFAMVVFVAFDLVFAVLCLSRLSALRHAAALAISPSTPS